MSELTVMADDPTDAEILARRRERDRRGAGTGEYVGFIGCAKAGVLKVRVHSREKHVMEVACACGEVHMTPNPMIRERLSGELVTLIEEGTPMTVSDDPDAASDPGSARRRVSDAAIFDSVPVGRDALLRETAEAVGYAGESAPEAFTRRVRRMNKRAEKEGAPAPFIITRGSGAKPALIRQAGP